MFAEVHLPLNQVADRDDVEDAVSEVLLGRGTVVGAGTGLYGSNLDLDLHDEVSIDLVVVSLVSAVRSLGLTGASVRFDGSSEWHPLS